MTMNKKELIINSAEKNGSTKKASSQFLEDFCTIMTEALAKGESVGTGTFAARERAIRTVRNPRINTVSEVPAAKVLMFKPGKVLKDIVNDR